MSDLAYWVLHPFVSEEEMRKMTAAQRPSITDAMRAVDEDRTREQVSEEILAVTEDFVEYVARRGRGITVATPERRRLREAIERIVLSFVRNAEDPGAMHERVTARLDGIMSQSARLSTPQNASEDPPPAPPIVPDENYRG